MYQEMIKNELAEIGRTEIDPRHIEAFMRLEYKCLDGLSSSKFRKELLVSVRCCDVLGSGESEKLAKSLGL